MGLAPLILFSKKQDGNMSNLFDDVHPSGAWTNRRFFLDKNRLKGREVSLMKPRHEKRIQHVLSSELQFPKCDGLVIFRRGIFSGLALADCLPVILVAYSSKIGLIGISLIYAGRMGTEKEISRYGVEQLCKAYLGIDQIRVIFGPHIKTCCYEFLNPNFNSPLFSDEDGETVINLLAENEKQIKEESNNQNVDIIFDSSNDKIHCTCCATDIDENHLYFSHRRSETQGEPHGRNIVIVGMVPEEFTIY